MQVKLGPLVSDAAGSIGGTTFQRSFLGAQVRTKPLPTRRRTTYTAGGRSEQQYLSRRWRVLTPTQRSDWQTQADAMSWENKFGDPIRGKGYWLFMRCNQYLALVKEALIDTPGTLGRLDAITDPSGDFSPAADWKIIWTAPAAVSAGQYWALFATRWQSKGRSADFGGLRYLGRLRDGETPGFNAAGLYAARFGALPPSGYSVFARLLPIDYVSGYQGVPVDWIAST
jgi:hypothetical protein